MTSGQNFFDCHKSLTTLDFLIGRRRRELRKQERDLSFLKQIQKGPHEDRRLRSHDRVSVGAQSSRSLGSPINQRLNSGFNRPLTTVSAKDPLSVVSGSELKSWEHFLQSVFAHFPVPPFAGPFEQVFAKSPFQLVQFLPHFLSGTFEPHGVFPQTANVPIVVDAPATDGASAASADRPSSVLTVLLAGRPYLLSHADPLWLLCPSFLVYCYHKGLPMRSSTLPATVEFSDLLRR